MVPVRRRYSPRIQPIQGLFKKHLRLAPRLHVQQVLPIGRRHAGDKPSLSAGAPEENLQSFPARHLDFRSTGAIERDTPWRSGFAADSRRSRPSARARGCFPPRTLHGNRPAKLPRSWHSRAEESAFHSGWKAEKGGADRLLSRRLSGGCIGIPDQPGRSHAGSKGDGTGLARRQRLYGDGLRVGVGEIFAIRRNGIRDHRIFDGVGRHPMWQGNWFAPQLPMRPPPRK